MADEKMRETLSALVDGEMGGDDIERSIRGLQNEAEQRQVWQRYHLIGDAMRKSLPVHHDGSFANRVSQAVAAEEIPTSTVVEFKPKIQSHKPKTSYSRPMAGFALAASVAAVAYLGVGMIAVDEQAAVPRMASNSSPLVSPVAQSASLDGLQTVQGQRWNVDTPAVESRLNSYLHNHNTNTLSSVTAMNTIMLPNVRLAETQSVQGE